MLVIPVSAVCVFFCCLYFVVVFHAFPLSSVQFVAC